LISSPYIPKPATSGGFVEKIKTGPFFIGGGTIQPTSPDELLHQVRIECKKLRYLMEFFSELIPDVTNVMLQKRLRRLQSRLGDFNDASVQQVSLITYWKQSRQDTDTALGLGGLVAILYQRQQQSRTLIMQ